MVAYQIDSSHTGAHFKVRHMMISNVKGEFSKVTGAAEFDPANPGASHIEASIDTASINTRDAQRDGHLRSADFLDVEKYPEITFRSTKIVPSGTDSYDVTGELTIRGVAREVKLVVDSITPEVKDPWGMLRVGGSAMTKIKRSDFGLTWNAALEGGGFMVGDDVEITIDVELMRKA
jgi:polyisoprenoid-binding protein YceI